MLAPWCVRGISAPEVLPVVIFCRMHFGASSRQDQQHDQEEQGQEQQDQEEKHHEEQSCCVAISVAWFRCSVFVSFHNIKRNSSTCRALERAGMFVSRRAYEQAGLWHEVIG